MQSTLENLYYGGITPCDMQAEPDSALEKALRRAAECEERLTEQLAETEKSLLLDLINAHDEITGTIALGKFILGFRLGMRIAIEGLADDADLRVQHRKGVRHHAQKTRKW